MKYCLRKIAFVALGTFMVTSVTSLPVMAVPEVTGVMSTQQQNKRLVTGTITDAVDGSPIIGANITLKGSKTGAISDLDGNYSIQVNSIKDILVISYNGSRVYGKPSKEDIGSASLQVPENTEHLWLVVVATPKEIYDTGVENQWPYQFTLDNTEPDGDKCRVIKK